MGRVLQPEHFEPFNPAASAGERDQRRGSARAVGAARLESAAVASARVRDPLRNVARATLIGTTLAAFVTAAVCIAAMAIVPPRSWPNPTRRSRCRGGDLGNAALRSWRRPAR